MSNHRGAIRATDRRRAYIATPYVAVMLAVQAVIFAIWREDGDPPNGAVAIAFVAWEPACCS